LRPLNLFRMKNLIVFDFDKTLIRKDSFRLFCRMHSTYAQRFVFVALGILVKIKLLSNSNYKRIVLGSIFKGVQDIASSVSGEFIDSLNKNLNPKVIERLAKHLSEDDTSITVMSASPDFYLNDFIKNISSKITVFGTLYDRKTGRLIKNLHGTEKKKKLQELINSMKPEFVHVYTDGAADLGIIELSDRVTLINPDYFIKRKVLKSFSPVELIYG
jgi:phosphoserine phosphatase